MSSLQYFMGVDAGGSKTDALVVNAQGHVIGAGRSGNGNHQLGRDEAERNIRDAVQSALSTARMEIGDIAHAYFGLAGADREADYRILRPLIHRLGFANYGISCDTTIAMRAGTSLPYGIVLICGTGINCWGINPQGMELQIGGFGYMYGDHGGGADLAIEAFRAVVRAWEGRGPATALTGGLLSLFTYPDVGAMYNGFLDRGNVNVPLDVVPLLFDLAAAGDPVAIDILVRQGRELGVTAQAMIRRLGMEHMKFDIVLAGSIVVEGQGPYVYEQIVQAIRETAPLAAVRRLQVKPVIGAVLRAMDGAGCATFPEKIG